MDLGVGRQLSYRSGRRLLVLTGLIVLAATAAVLYVRRVEDVEIVAVLLFIPIYLAVVAGKVKGGVAAAVLASGVYAAMRIVGVDTFDSTERAQLIASRAAAYLVFGVVGGFAVLQLEAALTKLDRYDLVDDDTGLFNARFGAQELALELARGKRYASTFAVVVLDGPIAPLVALRRSRRSEALRRIGATVSDAVRLVDRAAIAQDGDRYRVAVIMPETPKPGALIVADRLVATVGAALDGAGTGLHTETLVFPDDADALDQLRRRFVELDHLEHPAHPEPGPPASD